MFWFRKKNRLEKYFISIGAGKNQLPLIAEARKLGLKVIGVDKNISAPGIAFCDIKIQESIENHEAVYQTIIELMLDGIITGALSKSYGKAVCSAAFMNEKFNRPHIPYLKCSDFLNKSLMKNIYLSAGIKTPAHCSISQKNIKNYNFKNSPVVIKPLNGHAKEGVRLINSIEDYKKFVTDNPAERHNLIVEEAITGDEIIAVGIICGGRYHIVEITDKQTSSPPGFLDLVHSSPTPYYSMIQEITSIGSKIAETFNIVNSPLIMEFIISTSQEIYLIEAVPEFGGEYLTDLLIQKKSGYNMVRESVKAITGLNFSPPPDPVRSKGGFAVRYILPESGKVPAYTLGQVRKMPGVVMASQLIPTGTEIHEPASNHHRSAVIAAKGRTVTEAVEITGRAAKCMISVEDENQ